MTFESSFLLSLAQAASLGLGVALLLWLLRGLAVVRRVRASLFLTALAAGLALVLRGAGLPGDSLPARLALSASLLLGANTALQLFDMLLWDYLFERRRHIAVPRLLVDLFNFVALAAAALAVLNGVFGVELSALLVTSTVASAVIGLALQDMLASIIAGLALQLERPFAVGDWVMVNQQEGQVVQMNWRTLTLRTRDNHIVFIPNGSAARQEIVNYSRPTPLQRLHVEVGVAYPHPPEMVESVISQALRGVSGVLDDPAPEVIVKSFGDFAVHYDARFWTTDYARRDQIRGEAHKRVWYGLRRAGLTIPFPVRDVYLHTVSDEQGQRAAERERQVMFDGLRPLPLFQALSDEQVRQLVTGAALERYTQGEALVRQGQAGDSLYVIRSGQVRVEARDEAGQTALLDRLGPGQFFGEMSLLTGEPRSASVVAETETVVVVVDKPDLAAVLAADSNLLESLTTSLEERLRNAAQRRALGTGPLPDERRLPPHTVLVASIRRFFGLK